LFIENKIFCQKYLYKKKFSTSICDILDYKIDPTIDINIILKRKNKRIDKDYSKHRTLIFTNLGRNILVRECVQLLIY